MTILINIDGHRLLTLPPLASALARCARRFCSFAPHLLGRLVFPQLDVNGVSQKVVSCPGQIGDLGDKLRLDPMHTRKTGGPPPSRVQKTMNSQEFMEEERKQ
jgi:hypothetical protein